MTFDDILSQVGAFGPYQRRVYFLMTLIAIPSALHTFSGVFLSAKTDYWCAAPELAGYNCSTLPASDLLNGSSGCSFLKRKLGIPQEQDKDTGNIRFAQCKRYNLTGVNLDDRAIIRRVLTQPPLVVADEGEEGIGYAYEEVGGSSSNESMGEEGSLTIIPCDAGWEYDTSQYLSTINHEYGLVCENAGNAKYAQSAYFAGMLLGSFLIGILADWLGRKPTFFLCVILSFLAGIAQAFAPTLIFFIVVRFFVAVFKTGTYLMAFVIGTEFVGPSIRAFAGQFINIYYATGYMLLAPMAYVIREWKMLQLALTMTYVPFILLVPFIPESARWLLSRGRRADAEKILKVMAKVNKAKLPEVLFDDDDVGVEKVQPQTSPVRRYTYIDLVRTPNMCCKTLNLVFCWFVNNMVYYGISLSTSDLGVDHYIAAFISGAVEIPAYTSAILVMQYIGRRVPLCTYLVTGGLACVGATFFVPGAARVAIAMIGKFCITATFGMVYTYSAEIYPTPVRSMGLGLSSMMARVSGILCPFILDLSSVWFSLPYTIFGACAITSGLLILLLPETHGKPLPETLEAGENLGKGQLIRCLSVYGKREQDGPQINMEKPLYSGISVADPLSQKQTCSEATEEL